MRGGVEVFRCVLVRRVIATTDVSTEQTLAEMYPASACFDALFAALFIERLWIGEVGFFESFQMFAGLHGAFSVCPSA